MVEVGFLTASPLRSMHASDHVAFALLIAYPGSTSRHLADELDCTRTYAAARLRSLERQGLAAADLAEGGHFRWTATPAGRELLADLPEPLTRTLVDRSRASSADRVGLLVTTLATTPPCSPLVSPRIPLYD
jgi:hypothetical protein